MEPDDEPIIGPFFKKPARNKIGCFCCRKRKIKCDYTRPSCKNCGKLSYLCIWTKGGESLSHKKNFKLVKLGNTNEGKLYKNFNSESTALQVAVSNDNINFDLENFSPIHLSNTIGITPFSNNKKINENYNVQISDVILTDIPVDKSPQSEIEEDAVFRKFLSESIHIPLSGVKIWFPECDLDDAYFYDAFINGFMVSVSPQLAHIKLQPGSVIIPSGMFNPVVQSLFIACGSSFLSHVTNNEEIKRLCAKKCDLTILKVAEYIEYHDITGNEDWLLIYLLLYYVKEKFSSYDSIKTKTLNIIAVIEMVKLWLLNKNQSKKEEGKLCKKRGSGNFDNLLSLDDETMYLPQDEFDKVQIFSKIFERMRYLSRKQGNETNSNTELLQKEMPINSSFAFDLNISTSVPINETYQNIKITPFEKTVLEIFAYNYTKILFTCDRRYIKDLVSPFEIFESLRPYLYTPIYECAVPWMNNPVVGATLPILELEAKLNWISLQMPLSDENRQQVDRILKIAKFYAHPILPLEVYQKESESVHRRLMESCYASGALAKAVTIFAMKLLNPELSSAEPEVQMEISAAFSYLTRLSLHSQVSVIMNWTMIIIGAATIDCDAQDYLLWRIKNFTNAHKLNSYSTIVGCFKKAWDKNVIPGRGWDVLLDHDTICSLIL
ncbi:hypothetical protein DAMA08_007580 [Martiniozyma asiatica (nom. inval.)]|nr:hypothetical protein DAMA08_007580 [Martiniozyma asiatica]